MTAIQKFIPSDLVIPIVHLKAKGSGRSRLYIFPRPHRPQGFASWLYARDVHIAQDMPFSPNPPAVFSTDRLLSKHKGVNIMQYFQVILLVLFFWSFCCGASSPGSQETSSPCQKRRVFAKQSLLLSRLPDSQGTSKERRNMANRSQKQPWFKNVQNIGFIWINMD